MTHSRYFQRVCPTQALVFCKYILFYGKMKYRIGQGYDVHAFGEGLPMWLCGVRIDSPFGFIAHSDGDVAIHALCDALLGALALGDIGKHFPDTSDEFKGISSAELLRRTLEMVRAKGWDVENVDITIALQTPRIGNRITEMRSSLASVMGVEEDCISVKATTTEKLGFVGRKEGCEALAVALLHSSK